MRKIFLILIGLILLQMGYAKSQTVNQIIDSLEHRVQVLDSDIEKVKIYTDLCWYYKTINVDSSEANGKRGLILAISIKDLNGASNCLTDLANLYADIGDHMHSINYNFRALKIREYIGNLKGTSSNLNNIGISYQNWNDFQSALKIYYKSRKIREELGLKHLVSETDNNIAGVYSSMKMHDSSLYYYNKSLTVKLTFDNLYPASYAFLNIASIHMKTGNYHDSILMMMLDAEKILAEFEDRVALTRCWINIGEYYSYIKEHKKAENYYLIAYEMAKKMNNETSILKSANGLSKIYSVKGDYKSAYVFNSLARKMEQSFNNQSYSRSLIKAQYNYDNEKREAVEKVEKEKRLALNAKEKEKQHLFIGSLTAGLIMVVIFLLFVFNRLKITRKQKDVIENQKELVEIAHSELEEKSNEILDSINYAKRIQTAILPSEKIIKKYLQDSFILYKPKDIVAGDFIGWNIRLKRSCLPQPTVLDMVFLEQWFQ